MPQHNEPLGGSSSSSVRSGASALQRPKSRAGSRADDANGGGPLRRSRGGAEGPFADDGARGDDDDAGSASIHKPPRLAPRRHSASLASRPGSLDAPSSSRHDGTAAELIASVLYHEAKAEEAARRRAAQCAQWRERNATLRARNDESKAALAAAAREYAAERERARHIRDLGALNARVGRLMGTAVAVKSGRLQRVARRNFTKELLEESGGRTVAALECERSSRSSPTVVSRGGGEAARPNTSAVRERSLAMMLQEREATEARVRTMPPRHRASELLGALRSPVAVERGGSRRCRHRNEHDRCDRDQRSLGNGDRSGLSAGCPARPVEEEEEKISPRAGTCASFGDEAGRASPPPSTALGLAMRRRGFTPAATGAATKRLRRHAADGAPEGRRRRKSNSGMKNNDVQEMKEQVHPVSRSPSFHEHTHQSRAKAMLLPPIPPAAAPLPLSRVSSFSPHVSGRLVSTVMDNEEIEEEEEEVEVVVGRYEDPDVEQRPLPNNTPPVRVAESGKQGGQCANSTTTTSSTSAAAAAVASGLHPSPATATPQTALFDHSAAKGAVGSAPLRAKGSVHAEKAARESRRFLRLVLSDARHTHPRYRDAPPPPLDAASRSPPSHRRALRPPRPRTGEAMLQSARRARRLDTAGHSSSPNHERQHDVIGDETDKNIEYSGSSGGGLNARRIGRGPFAYLRHSRGEGAPLRAASAFASTWISQFRAAQLERQHRVAAAHAAKCARREEVLRAREALPPPPSFDDILDARSTDEIGVYEDDAESDDGFEILEPPPAHAHTCSRAAPTTSGAEYVSAMGPNEAEGAAHAGHVHLVDDPFPSPPPTGHESLLGSSTASSFSSPSSSLTLDREGDGAAAADALSVNVGSRGAANAPRGAGCGNHSLEKGTETRHAAPSPSTTTVSPDGSCSGSGSGEAREFVAAVLAAVLSPPQRKEAASVRASPVRGLGEDGDGRRCRGNDVASRASVGSARGAPASSTGVGALASEMVAAVLSRVLQQ